MTWHLEASFPSGEYRIVQPKEKGQDYRLVALAYSKGDAQLIVAALDMLAAAHSPAGLLQQRRPRSASLARRHCRHHQGHAMKHTGGEWRIENLSDRYRIVAFDRGFAIADVEKRNNASAEEIEANARVLAAASDMKAALERLSYAFARPEWQHAIAAFQPELEAARKAILKSEGVA